MYYHEFVGKINTRKNQPSVKVDINDLWNYILTIYSVKDHYKEL